VAATDEALATEGVSVAALAPTDEGMVESLIGGSLGDEGIGAFFGDAVPLPEEAEPLPALA
jgi:hypothetical protein